MRFRSRTGGRPEGNNAGAYLRSGRPCLRPRDMGQGWQRGSANGESQEFAARKFNGALPEVLFSTSLPAGCSRREVYIWCMSLVLADFVAKVI